MKPVDLGHRGLTKEEKLSVKEAFRQGWFHARGEAKRREIQMSAWLFACYENRADYVCFDERGDELWLEASKMNPMPLSVVFGEEKRALCKRWKLRNLRHQPVRLPKGTDKAKLAGELLDLFARDRSPARTAELQKRAHEGMAEVVDGSGYWPDLEFGQKAYAYIIPIAGKPGRCVALRHLKLPLVDVPLEDFRLLDEDE